MTTVEFSLNREAVRVDVDGDEVLSDTLRTLGIPSVRVACGMGICGTCTVAVDRRVVSSCLLLTASVSGADVVTSEGLVDDRGLSRVHETFVRRGAYQCAFCIPAMVVTVHAALEELKAPTLHDVRRYLAGNLCRCGTYPEILAAVTDLLAAPGHHDA